MRAYNCQMQSRGGLTGSVQGSRSLGAKGGPVQERQDTGPSAFPMSVRLYSTFGGTSGCTSRPEDLVSFELSKLLDQHLLRDAGNSALQFRKPHNGLREEVRQDHHFPPALETTKRCLHVSHTNRPVASAAAPVLCRCGYHLVCILPSRRFLRTRPDLRYLRTRVSRNKAFS
jgi:hypothetical protein